MHRAILLVAVCAASLAQEPVVVRINVTLVQVDAVVTDAKNRHVGNLKAADFEILEDGKPQKITNFSYVLPNAPVTPVPKPVSVAKSRLAVPAPPIPAGALKKADVRRTMAFVVDDLALSFEGTVHVRDGLHKFVNREMQPGDLIAIVRTSAGMGALQQFTNDKNLLNAAIDRIKFGFGRVGVDSFDPTNIDRSRFAKANAAANARVDQLRSDNYLLGSLGAIGYVVD
ncbi:MAG TPA: VWA domain-containing protein, partial [Bryobacteraceae bacterium]|nr:VWA domain-containing protein [Bryobacteraceae bacterium]